MFKLPLTATALAATLMAAPIAAQTVPAAQTEMTSEEIREVAVGKTTFGTFADRPLSYAVFVAPDGRLIGKLMDGESEQIETGIWKIENNRLIGQWDNLKDGEANAFAYVRVGENVHAIRDDGSLDRVQFFVEGDPLGLSAGGAPRDAAASVQAFVSEWSNAWSPGDAAENWSYEDTVGPLYSDNVLAFDLTEDVTVIRGKADHREIWQPFMRGFDRWRFTALPHSVDIDVVEDAAFVTLFVNIEGLRANGERFSTPAQATLFLTENDNSWQIEHEHISLPRKE